MTTTTFDYSHLYKCYKHSGQLLIVFSVLSFSLLLFTHACWQSYMYLLGNGSYFGKGSLWCVHDVLRVQSDHVDDVEIVETNGKRQTTQQAA